MPLLSSLSKTYCDFIRQVILGSTNIFLECMVGKMHGMKTWWVFKESSISFHILSAHNTFHHVSTIAYGMVSCSSSFPATWSLHQWHLLSKTHLPMQETKKTQVQSPGWEESLEEEKATRLSILAWEIPWAEKPGGLQSRGPPRVRHNWVTEHILLVKKKNVYICIFFFKSVFILSLHLVRFIWREFFSSIFISLKTVIRDNFMFCVYPLSKCRLTLRVWCLVRQLCSFSFPNLSLSLSQTLTVSVQTYLKFIIICSILF